MDTMFKNAITSIELGFEDYLMAKNGNIKRALSAVRNIAAGILLLYKERLLRADGNERILYKKLLPEVNKNTGKVEFVGEGSTTLDFHQIKAYFKSLGIDGKVKIFENKLRKYRNEIEHYYSENVNINRLDEWVSDALTIIFSFMAQELTESPVDNFENYSQLERHKEAFEALEKDKAEKFKVFEWGYSNAAEIIESEAYCLWCTSTLVVPDSEDEDSLRCWTCSDKFSIKDGLTDWTCSFNKDDWYEDSSAKLCPMCHGVFNSDTGHCLQCEYELDYTHCRQCDEVLGLDEQDLGGICGGCQHFHERAMDS